MSVSKTGWIIAAATAVAFAAGCAGQHHGEMGASCAGEAAVPAAHGCKGMSECKAKVVKHHRHHAKVIKQEKVEEVTAPVKEETTEAK